MLLQTRVDLMSNDMTWRQMIGVGVRNVVLARGESSINSIDRGANIQAVAGIKKTCGYSIVFNDVEQCSTSLHTSGEWP